VVSDLVEKAKRSPDGANMARNQIKSPAMRERLEIVLGRQKAEEIVDAMERLSTMTKTRNEVLEGSQTSSRTIQQDILTGGQEAGLADAGRQLIQGDVMGAAQAAMRRPSVMNKRVAEETLNLLGQANQGDILEALRRLQAMRGSNLLTGTVLSPAVNQAAGVVPGAWER
jgi:hypothetical protein